MAAVYDAGLLDNYLSDYYKNLYPVKWIMKWLSYGKEAKDEYLARREFAFILENDVHIRYLTFTNEHDVLKELSNKKPHKIDLGAVYNHKTREHKSHIDFKAIERELVFDIDLTDYDPFRTCCQGTNVCHKCWRWIVIAVRVLDQLLRDHFGFLHRLWVFSGRRGIHCWVADEKARKLTNSGRSAVAKYLTYDANEPPFSKTHVHPMAEVAYRVMMDSEDMEKLVIEQGWLDSSERWEPILRICKDDDLRESLEKQFAEVPSAEARWTILKRRFDSKEREKAAKKGDLVPDEVEGEAKNFLLSFVLAYAYPKLDVNVSTGTNHLLKSPFCIHPKTGMIAVPLNPKTIHKVNLADIPRVDRLISEMSKIKKAADEETQENRKTLYYKHTSLAPYVETFEAFVNAATARS